MTSPEIAAIPRALADRPIWLAYRLEDKGKGRLSKPPVSPRTGYVCSKTDESEQVTLTEALVGMERYDLPGVGVVLPDGMLCIDLDDCFEDTGALKPIAQDIYDHFSTYTEYSPSGNGLHIFMFGIKPNNRTKDTASGIEVYAAPNFLTVTGDVVDGAPSDLTEQQDALEWLYEKYLPPIVSPEAACAPVDHGERTPAEWLTYALGKDEKLKRLYTATDHDGDESSADFALLSKLAYWLNRDTAAMTAAFAESPWAHTKDAAHTRKIERADYLTDSAVKAAALCPKTANEDTRTFATKAVRFFTPTMNEDGTESVALEHYTDMCNAEAMQTLFDDVLCYTPEWGWCYFDGVRWETDVSYRAMHAAKTIAEGLMLNAESWLEHVKDALAAEEIDPTSDVGKARLQPPMALYAHALKSQSEHGLTAMVALNKAFMQVSASAFDTDPWLINTPAGVIDLRRGEVMPHDARYRLTSLTTVTPNFDAPTPMWDAFLKRIFCDDYALIDFVQVVLGSALVGKVYTENLIIANGSGSNGKSTLFNTIQYLLGDYATAIDPNLLMSGKSGEQQVGMAMVEGTRFAVAQETEEGQRLSSSMLKRMVSTDKMVAKRLYKDPHTFTPSHTLVLSTNHLPKISSTDTGTWRRIIVLPFEATIPPEDIITDFHSLLMEREGAGILAWAIRGAAKFYEANCDLPARPEAVQRASVAYRSDEDWISRFLDECCYPPSPHDESYYARHNDIYRIYREWAHRNGDYIRTSSMFGRSLQTAGFHGESKFIDPDSGATIKMWYGLRLLESTKFTLVKGDDRKATIR